jgi:hypothetical protein
MHPAQEAVWQLIIRFIEVVSIHGQVKIRADVLVVQ